MNSHTILGGSVGKHCGNCDHYRDDDTCDVRLIAYDETVDPFDWTLPTCPDWKTMFSQYEQHHCGKKCHG